jgi:hypothetical protein
MVLVAGTSPEERPTGGAADRETGLTGGWPGQVVGSMMTLRPVRRAALVKAVAASSSG